MESHAAPVEASLGLTAAFDERMARGQLDLPVIPTVIGELNAAISQHADARRLADIVRRDPAVAAHLLRLANSPLYRPREPLVSVQHAISRLGTDKLKQVALAVALQCRVFSAPGFDDVIHEILRHSLAAAFFAQEVARVRRANADDGFLCGLLHDIGKPVALQTLLDVVPKALQGVPAVRAEIFAVIDARHAEAGHMLAVKWSLPEKVQHAVRLHHGGTPPAAVAGAVFTAALSDALAHVALDDAPAETVTAHPSLGPLELYPDAVEQLLGRCDVIRASVAEVAA